MKKRRFLWSSHYSAPAVFLLLSAAALLIVMGDADRPQPVRQQMAIEVTPDQNEAAVGETDTVLPGVLEGAELYRREELAYLQDKPPYTTDDSGVYLDSRLENIRLVHICDDISGEVFEVYEPTYQYRISKVSGWITEQHDLSVYLVFRPMADGTRQWVCHVTGPSVTEKSQFVEELHKRLMDVDDTVLCKLCANLSLKETLKQTIYEKEQRVLPGDGYYTNWKPLDEQWDGSTGTVYGLLLYYTSSGSPLIKTRESGRYDDAIFGAFCLPVAISYRRDDGGIYVVTGYWAPSPENFEADLRGTFPAGTAEDVLKNIDAYMSELLAPAEYIDGQRLFSHGPVWPGYTFHEDLDDIQLMEIVYYYGIQNTYTKPVREELLRRFADSPEQFRQTLAELPNPEQQEYISRILAGTAQGLEYTT